MPSQLELAAEPRTTLGKQVKNLRHAGIVPANLYGHGLDSRPIQVDVRALQETLRRATSTTLINLKVGETDRARPVFVRDVRWHLLKHEPIHVDFFAVRMDEKMRAVVPLVQRGEAPAVRSADLILLHAISQLHVEGLPADLPETIAVDVTDLTEVDQAIHVRDLAVPANVTVLDDPDELVVKVQQTRAAVEPEAPSEAAEESAQGAAQGDKSDA